jgi:polyisoprenoid-binding protein YceI
MKKILVSLTLLSVLMYGSNLKFQSGYIKGHTEVFGDNTIDPVSHKATSKLTIVNNPDTIKGTVEVSIKDFISDNSERDEHMQSVMESSSFPKAIYNISSITPTGGDKYTLNGTLNLHGISKPLSFNGTITNEGKYVHIKAKSKIKLTDFGITPPKLLLLTVRNQIDLSVDMLLK